MVEGDFEASLAHARRLTLAVMGAVVLYAPVSWMAASWIDLDTESFYLGGSAFTIGATVVAVAAPFVPTLFFNRRPLEWWARRSSGEPDASAALLSRTFVGIGFYEIPALLGLVLVLVGGSWFHGVSLMAVSLLAYVVNFPRRDRWAEAVTQAGVPRIVS
jgi:hypothetical protein